MATSSHAPTSSRPSDDQRERLLALLAAKKEIDRVLMENQPIFEILQENRQFDIKSILHFANNITQTIRAPVDWAPGLPLCGHPPAPLLEQMRAGVLERYNRQFVGGGIEKSAAAAQVTLPAQTESRRMREDDETDADVEQQPSKRVKFESVSRPSNSDLDSLDEADNVIPATNIITAPEPVPLVTPVSAPLLPTPVEPAATGMPPSTAETPASEERPETPVKQTRNINISFGFSDSESEDEDDD
jgi:hypothetical protein